MRLLVICLASWLLAGLLTANARADGNENALAQALHQTFPKFLPEIEIAQRYSAAALAAEAQTGVPAELLLAIPAIESNFDPRVISRKECRTNGTDGTVCRRVGGRWRGPTTKPSNVHGSYFCGLHQTGGAISWATCWQIIRAEEDSFLAAAVHLRKWYDEPKYCRRVRSETARWTCALYGYGGGYPLIERSRTFTGRITARLGALYYPMRVRRLETLLRAKRQRLALTAS